ncbi:putative Autophagy-related protein 11 [Glarea lozoyensis 74030]|uniref:Autophagy-related protein 11 n=1 Tax=Glarea lozoyensis (strain ATCC 74030 / MF5533) TaxID=1104152 RepID=H0EQE3_GLAL7|nr:putative Autophagy-related protein 11 [Glarea lozoyensis 74030]
MALQVSFAHTGQRLQVDPGTFTSIDDFRSWVARNSSVSVQNHVGLTRQGKPVKLPMLSTEADKEAQLDITMPTKYTPSKAPDTIADQKNLEAWKDLFKARRSWALEIVETCMAMSNEAQERYSEAHVMALGVDAVIYNLEKHVKALDQKNADIQTWSKDIQKEQEAAGTNWDTSVGRLRSLPASSDMVDFITGRTPRKNRPSSTLEDLVDQTDVQTAGKIVRSITSKLNKDSAALGTKVDQVLQEMDSLFDKVESDPTRSISTRINEPIQLMEDIEAVAKKISNDYESVLGYANNSKNISQASKSALLHTKNLLPSLLKRASEMDAILHSSTEARNAMAARSLDIMHDISSITALLSDANLRFAALNVDDEGLDALHMLELLNTLPTTYASFIAEAIRRREWTEKMRSDSTTLANEMATFQDEEARRRRKWQKATGSMLWGDKPERKVTGVEVNFHDDEEDWPQATRQDLEQLLDVLKSLDGNSQLVTNVSKIFTELNNPTKQQSKRARAFKAGSIHEAALGRSALLVRGDDESIRVLQEERQKTENKLKTAESRIRRLEGLLHQQSQSRSSTGNIFQSQGQPSPDPHITNNPLASPHLLEDQSRRSSVSSRRFSAHHGADEKAFQQKLLSAEADANAEREKVAGLEKEIASRITKADDLKVLVDEANSTKQDLLQNFEAQQREFMAERKSLEDEIKRMKVRLEEVDEEVERLLGSREASVEDRVRELQDDLERLQKTHAAELQKTQGQVDFLRNDSKLQRETNANLERQILRLKEDNRELLQRAEKAESTAEEQLQVLYDIHAQLSPKSKKSLEPAALAEVLVSLSGDLVSELESVKSDATIARSDRDAANKEIVTVKEELAKAQETLSKEKQEVTRLRELLDSEQAKFNSIKEELVDERDQLSSLRTKISDGETGSEALRNRLEEEERKVTRISEDLATRQSRIGSLEEELRTFQEKHEFAKKRQTALISRFDARTDRTKDLSRRVYNQNDRLCRLLERLSYSVTREGNSMTIQRIPRPDKSNANDSSDPGSSLRKSSANITRKAMIDSGDLDLLYWMHNDDLEEESAKYEAFLNSIGNFDVEAFCEVITKRLKDVEYTAKKYNKDARAYREKSHVAQKEAHEKIAYKHFKEGDLALFLPTRNQATGAWAAFNVGAPHYFLREHDSHKLQSRDWLLARIHKISDRVVDLSKSMSSSRAIDGKSIDSNSIEDDNPFELSDGLRWYLIEATEEKPGAPSTPGLGKSTVASARIDATGDIRRSKKSSSSVEGINKTLSKSLDSRRSSVNSKKAVPLAASSLIKNGTIATDAASLKASSTTGLQSPAEPAEAHISRPRSREDAGKAPINPEVRHSQIVDSLMGP